jgi:hypothetical protein
MYKRGKFEAIRPGRSRKNPGGKFFGMGPNDPPMEKSVKIIFFRNSDDGIMFTTHDYLHTLSFNLLGPF